MAEVDFRFLIPHQGKMCLLERVIEWDVNRITLSTRTHLDPLNPLRRDSRLRALHLCEYGAQSMAVHGALKAHEKGERAPPGVLVSLRDVQLSCDYIETLRPELVVASECLHASAGSMQYRFVISHQEHTIASGRAAVITMNV